MAIVDHFPTRKPTWRRNSEARSAVPDPIKDGNPPWTRSDRSGFMGFESLHTERAMSKVLLLLALLCGSALSAEPEDPKQRKRGVLGPSSGGWVGIPNPYGYGHGHPWSGDHNPWKGLKLPAIDLRHHDGWQYGGGAGGIFAYGRGGFALPSLGHDIVKTLPVFITKHVVVEKPVPVPEPVIIEKPFPVEKVIPVPVEKIIHKAVPVPVPVPQAYPVHVEHAIPIPVKHPVAVPIQQPYPVPVKHAVPIPVPVPVPVPIPPPFPSIYGGGGISGPFFGRGYASGPFYGPIHGHPPSAAHFAHGFSHGFGHGLPGHELHHGHSTFHHGLGYAYDPYAIEHGHYGHEHKDKRSKN